jgi:GT2 family glycosyltransferase
MISFVIVTMNRSDSLMRCLESIVHTSSGFDYEIIVVDNGSTDDTQERVRQQYPQSIVIANDTNMGPAGSRNRGVLSARGEICFFLDDDAVLVHSDAIARSLKYFSSNPDIACLNFTVRNGWTKINEKKYRPRLDKKKIGDCHYSATFCGGACAITRTVFSELGGYWEPYFYSCEELDLAFRLLDHGYRILTVDDIVVDHFETDIGRPAGQYLYFNGRNRPWVAIRNLPIIYVFSYCLLWWGDILRRGILSGQFFEACRGIVDSLKGLNKALFSRNKISSNTLDYLKTISGRLLY